MAESGFGTELLQLDGLSADPSSPENGMFWFNSTEGVYKLRVAGLTRILPCWLVHVFSAIELSSPVNADWAVNALAPLATDDNNNALSVRRFDDSTEEGVGFSVLVPPNVSRMRTRFVSRAVTAPGAAKAVALNLYERGLPGVADAWSSAIQLTNVDIPTNEQWQYDEQVDTLANWGLIAGQIHQFELTRDTTDAADTLVGDWALLQVALEFF